MRGLFVCPISTELPSNRGILNKMEYERDALAQLAGTTDVVSNSLHGPLLGKQRLADYPITGRGFSSFNHYVLFYRYVSKHCRLADYDFLYIRYPLAIPSFLRFLRDAKNAHEDIKIVVEVPTFPYRRELRSPKQRVLLALDDLGSWRLKNHVDAIVTFYGQREIFGIPCIQSENGIDVERVPERTNRPSKGALSMIVVANLARWHGIDRLISGLARNMPNGEESQVILNIVGEGPAEGELRALVRDLGLQESVHFHGIRTGQQLDALFEQADVAVDSLGLHRKGLRRSSSLKAREYCARGIPFVLTCEDPDFPSDLPFVRYLPADESPIDVATLIDFAETARRRGVYVGREMRRYAETRLTWEKKLEPVIRYLRTGELPSAQ
jgi:hypothetical protein